MSDKTTIPGVDQSVLMEAAALSEAQQQAPEWLWNDDGRLSYGRWPKRGGQVPYIRADIVLRALGLIEKVAL